MSSYKKNKLIDAFVKKYKGDWWVHYSRFMSSPYFEIVNQVIKEDEIKETPEKEKEKR